MSLVDISAVFNKKQVVTSLFSCYLTYNYQVMYMTTNNKLSSISSIFKGSVWIERELKELTNMYFIGLKDTRRLLSDYLQINYNFSSYKTQAYNLMKQNINKMLHWLFIFIYFLTCLILSLIFLNRSLLSTLIVSEVMIIILFCIGLVVGAHFNVYYVLIFSFFLLVLGGLELSLNILLFLL